MPGKRRIIMANDRNNKTFRLVFSGIMLALAFALSFVKLPFLPYGGSVTLFSMVPIVLVGCVCGNLWGLLVGLVYSGLQIFQSAVFSKAFIDENGWRLLLMILLDFVVAFAVLGLGGMFVTKKNVSQKSMPWLGAAGAAIVSILRYLSHIASGYILFRTYAEWFFTEKWVNAMGDWAMKTFSGNRLGLVYSVIYNGLYMIPEIIITTIGTFVVLMVLRNIKSTNRRIIGVRNEAIF